MKKLLHAMFSILMVLSSAPAFAETERALLLAKETKDFARCADVAIGNLANDQEAQKAITHLYRAMLENVSEMIAEEKGQKGSSVEFMINAIGEKKLLASY